MHFLYNVIVTTNDDNGSIVTTSDDNEVYFIESFSRKNFEKHIKY